MLRRLSTRFAVGAVLVGASCLVKVGLAVEGPVVLGFELARELGRQFDSASSRESLSEQGFQLLLGLGCTNCHSSPSLPRTPAPRLDRLGSGRALSFERRFLADPQAAKPGSRMPSFPFLQRQQNDSAPAAAAPAVDALLAYVASGNTEPRPAAPAKSDKAKQPSDASTTERLPGDGERGRVLYHELGCVACHAPLGGYRPRSLAAEVDLPQPALRSVPLGHVGSKYRPEGLVAFLKTPLFFRPAGWMPDFGLSQAEATDVAAFLLAVTSKPGSDAGKRDAGLSAPDLVSQGRELYLRLRCAACHDPQQRSFVGTGAEAGAPLLAAIDPRRLRTAGCVSSAPAADGPHFDLDPSQLRAIETALHTLADPAGLPQDHVQGLALAGRGCLACHSRDGLGGPEPGREVFFVSRDDADLGDEGRLPPPLTGIGAKLLASVIQSTIAGRRATEAAERAAVVYRPYLFARMPGYGGDFASELTSWLVRNDGVAGSRAVERSGRGPWGRELVGSEGLGCITCHRFRGHRSLGIPGVDLAAMAERLRPEWFRDFLLDPSGYRPGTRMPCFWPDGQALSRIAGGDVLRQIDSIWVYLLEADQSPLPPGLAKEGTYELAPGERPIVFRTFLAGAGMHAVAVGFREGVHIAFDAETCRLAFAWEGRFLDAESTWYDRFTPVTKPLGSILWRFPSRPWLLRDSAGDAKPVEPRFGGYRLDERGVPTFLYALGGIEIEDTVLPVRAHRLVRRLRLRGAGEATWVAARAKEAKPLAAEGGWLLDGRDELELDLSTHSRARCEVVDVSPASNAAGASASVMVCVRLVLEGEPLELEVRWSRN